MPSRDPARWAGLSGLLGALAWIAGDILLVGREVDPARYPLLFSTHAGRVEAELARHLLGAPASTLMAGALCGSFGVPLYLFGTYHLWRQLRPAGPVLAAACALPVFVGFAWSPLPHAAFYFLGAVYQSALVAPAAAHEALLALGESFHRVLVWTFYPSVLASAIGLLGFSLAIAAGRTGCPRWMALTTNPILLFLAILLVTHLLPDTPSHGLHAATLNVVWLLVFAQSLAFGGTRDASR